jgi:hypothetical protein
MRSEERGHKMMQKETKEWGRKRIRERKRMRKLQKRKRKRDGKAEEGRNKWGPITVEARSTAPAKHWGRGFESHSRHGYLSAFILCLCCPV